MGRGLLARLSPAGPVVENFSHSSTHFSTSAAAHGADSYQTEGGRLSAAGSSTLHSAHGTRIPSRLLHFSLRRSGLHPGEPQSGSSLPSSSPELSPWPPPGASWPRPPRRWRRPEHPPPHPEASSSRGRPSRRGGGAGGTRSWCAWPPTRRRLRGARPSISLSNGRNLSLEGDLTFFQSSAL